MAADDSVSVTDCSVSHEEVAATRTERFCRGCGREINPRAAGPTMADGHNHWHYRNRKGFRFCPHCSADLVVR